MKNNYIIYYYYYYCITLLMHYNIIYKNIYIEIIIKKKVIFMAL
jgi:hypothetical protein